VEKYCKAGQATDDNIIRRMRIACRILKATNTHSEYVILLLLQCNSDGTNAPQCYVTRTLTLLFYSICICLNLQREFISKLRAD
jgi:hypothetical protein